MNVSDVLAPGGLVGRKLPGYEHRPQQLQMAELVARALADKEHLIVESGTGVGKSFAYLVPAIGLAAEQDLKRVVISTHTIALQEQLMEKDIPFLKKVLPVEFKAVLVKGRGNYLCLRRLTSASCRQDRLFGSERQLKNLWRLEDWAVRTQDGTIRTLPFSILPGVWQKVCADRHSCQGRSCEQFGKCFYQASRRKMMGAQILVVNHALFFADLLLREGPGRVLPSYDAVILDEAHQVEDVASDHLGGRMSSGQVEYLLNILYNPHNRKGLLEGIAHGRRVREAAEAARWANEQFFADLGRWQQLYGRSNGRLSEPNVVQNPLSPALGDLANHLRDLSLKLQEEQLELAGYAGQAEELASQLQLLMDQSMDGAVYWLEPDSGRAGRNGRPRWKLACAPVDVGPDLKRMLWEKVDSVVLTSATLSSGAMGAESEDFDFLRTRLGLRNVQGARLGSPFNFAEQVKVYIEAGLGNPNERELFLPRACEAIKKYVKMSRGRAFVLFTSWQMLDKAAEELSKFFENEGLTLLIQKKGLSRTRLLNKFRKDTASVLFATASFWQGVDVKGEALSNVIITKLPFAVPDEPLIEARIERIRSRGGNPFMEFQLPEAILRFKQGFGRLIRSREDRGIVVILDSRVVSTRYGKRFLEALPNCEVIVQK